MSDQVTIIPVMYRDGDNYKSSSAIICRGPITDELKARLRNSLDAGRWYVPTQLDLSHPGVGQWSSFPSDADHGWVEMDVDGIVSSETQPYGGYNSEPDEGGDITQFVERFESAAEAGWSPSDPADL